MSVTHIHTHTQILKINRLYILKQLGLQTLEHVVQSSLFPLLRVPLLITSCISVVYLLQLNQYWYITIN